MASFLNLLIFVICFLPRTGAFFFFPQEDPRWSHYWNLATNLLDQGTFGNAGERVTDIEPGYPFFLAALRWIFHENYHGVILLQIALASLGAVFLYRMVLEISGSRRPAIIAALLYSFYPYFIGQSLVIIEVVPFTVFWSYRPPYF